MSVLKLGPCGVFANNPPILLSAIPPINLTICETLKYQIPPETFFDNEDGYTRNLTLNLENPLPNLHNFTWISFDRLTQTIYIIPTVEIAKTQPLHGFRFNLSATDSSGNTSVTILVIFIVDHIPLDSYRLTVAAKIPEMFQNQKPIVQTSIEFLEAVEQYLGGGSGNIRVINAVVTPSRIRVTWSNCSHGYTPCDYASIESVRRATVFERGVPQPALIQALAPAFIVVSVVDDMRGPCSNKGPVTNGSITPLTAKLCERMQYRIPEDAFYDNEDGNSRNLSLTLVHSDLTPLPENYWLTFDTHSQSIIGYPNVDAANSQPESGYEFILIAKDRHGLSANTRIKIHHEETLTPSTYEVTLVLRALFGKPPNNVRQLDIIFGNIARYMKSDEKTIRLHSFTRTKPNSTVAFLTWSNCTFPGNGCDVLGISETSKRLKSSNGEILNEFREIFRPEFELQFVFEQRLGACLQDSNFPPIPTQRLEAIILRNFCGIWEYTLPESLFYDKEEGYTRNLTLSLKTNEFQEIPTNSWIQLEKIKQILYGFPALHQFSENATFWLTASDSEGKFSSAPLKTIFTHKNLNSTYHVTIELTSYLGATYPDVYHVRKFLEMLTSFLNVTVESTRVVNYEKDALRSAPKFIISWTNCNSGAKNFCDHKEIEKLRRKFINSRDKVSQEFLESMLPYFVPTRITFQELGPCKDAENSSFPKLVRPIGKILTFSGNLLKYKIPRNAFVDSSTQNFSLVLQFSNGTALPYDYWLKLDNVSSIITGVLLAQKSWNHTYRLVATNRHGNAAYDVFQISVTPKCLGKMLNYLVNAELVFAGNPQNLFSEFLEKLQLYFQPWYADRNFMIVSMNTILKTQNKYNITWSHNDACEKCDRVVKFFRVINKKFLYSNGTTRTKFINSFKPEFSNMDVSKVTVCTPKGGAITTVTVDKTDRWLLYVIPIIILLIFLLCSFIFFICRTFVCGYRSRKDTVILDERLHDLSSSPRDIHVTDGRRSRAAAARDDRLTVVNEEFVANSAFLNEEEPEILLDRRVLSSREIPMSEDAETRVVTPPLYSEAVAHLADRSRSPGNEVGPSSRIEMNELPVVATRTTPVLGAALDDRFGGKETRDQLDNLSEDRKIKLDASRSLSLESNSFDMYKADEWSLLDEDEPQIPRAPVKLRLPTPPDVGRRRLPPVPKPLNDSPGSSLANTPDRESQSPFGDPLHTSTPVVSLSTVNNSYHGERYNGTPSPGEFPRNSRLQPPRTPEYGIRSPIERIPPGQTHNYPISPRTNNTQPSYRGPQSPIGFPTLPERVPYVDSRGQPGINRQRSPDDDIRHVLGELRDTVNREFDRRTEVDQYLEFYISKN